MSVVSGIEVMIGCVCCCLFVYFCYCLASRSPKEPVSQGDRLVNTCLKILHVVYLFVYSRVELATHSTLDTQPEATYAQVNKPSPSNRPSQKKVTTNQ